MQKSPLVLLFGALLIVPTRADSLWEQAQRQQAAYNYEASVRAYAQSQIERNSRTFNTPSPQAATGGAGRNWTDYFAKDTRAADLAAERRSAAEAQRFNAEVLASARNSPTGKPPITADRRDSELRLWIYYYSKGLSVEEATTASRYDVWAFYRSQEAGTSTAQAAAAQAAARAQDQARAADARLQAEKRAAELRRFSPEGLQEAAQRDEPYALWTLGEQEKDPALRVKLWTRALESKVSAPLDTYQRRQVLEFLRDVHSEYGALFDDYQSRQWQTTLAREVYRVSDAQLAEAGRPADTMPWEEISARAALLMARASNAKLSDAERKDAAEKRDDLLWIKWLNPAYFYVEKAQALFQRSFYRFREKLERNSVAGRTGEDDIKALWADEDGSEIKDSAARGDARAMAMVGEAMIEGYIPGGARVSPNQHKQRGFEYITRAKDLKEPRALGLWSQQMFLRVQQNPEATQELAKQAFEAALEGALQRDANSLRNVALAHSRGWGTPKDVVKAVEAAEVAARAGDLKSEEFLVDQYYQAALAGDKSKNARLIEINNAMIARRDINAHSLKAVMFYRGVAYGQDIPKAVAFWKESAKIGNWDAARNLAKVTGLGIKGDTPQTSFPAIGLDNALQTFEDHCDGNGADQQYKLAMFYLNQPSGSPFLPEPDEAKAKLWLQKAADGGSDHAKALLLKYDENVGVWLKALRAQKKGP